MTEGILTGLRVLDFSHARAGPQCTMILGDLGADVIKVERPGGEGTRHNGPVLEEQSVDFLSVNRNKQSVVCDFTSADDIRLLYRLVDNADVVVQNLRPGVLNRIGFGADDLLEQNPRLIYCSVSGYGSCGELADEPCYDQVIQAYSGFMSITGTTASGPLRAGLPIADLVTGVFAAMGVLAAVVERDRSGRGQHVEVSLLESMVSLLSFQAMRYLLLGEVPGPQGNDHPILAPTGVYKAADGALTIASSTDDVFARLCRALGREDWLSSSEYADNQHRVANRERLNREIENTLRDGTVAEWIERLRSNHVPCGPLHNVGEALDDPQVRANNMVLTLDHPTLGRIPMLGFPIKFSRTPMAVRQHPPLLGEHDRAVRSGHTWAGGDSNRPGITVGLESTTSRVVGVEHTVAARGNFDLPVLATPELIFMLEDACASLIAEFLDQGEVSVGTNVDVSHLRALAPGAEIFITVRVVYVSGGRVGFRVRAMSSDERVIAAGWHRRQIVNRSRLEAGLVRSGPHAS